MKILIVLLSLLIPTWLLAAETAPNPIPNTQPAPEQRVIPNQPPGLFGFEDHQYIQPVKCSPDLDKVKNYLTMMKAKLIVYGFMSNTDRKTVIGMWAIPNSNYIVTMNTEVDGKKMMCLLYRVENVKMMDNKNGTSL